MKTLTIYRVADKFMVDYYNKKNTYKFSVSYRFGETEKLMTDIVTHIKKHAKISAVTIMATAAKEEEN